MITPQSPHKRVFGFTNEYGEHLRLTVDLGRQTGTLSCPDFGRVRIRDDRIQNAHLVLSSPEFAWLDRVWRKLFARPMVKLPFIRMQDLMVELQRAPAEDYQALKTLGSFRPERGIDGRS